MTENGYYYAQLRTTNEHYQRQDAENERAHKASEAFNLAQLDESMRHSKALEELNAREIDERIRANRAAEAENIRSHAQQEYLTRQQQLETALRDQAAARVARAQQREQARHDYETERAQNYRNVSDFVLGVAATGVNRRRNELQAERNQNDYVLGATQAEINKAYNEGRLDIEQQRADTAADAQRLAEKQAVFENVESVTRSLKNLGATTESLFNNLKSNQELVTGWLNGSTSRSKKSGNPNIRVKKGK